MLCSIEITAVTPMRVIFRMRINNYYTGKRNEMLLGDFENFLKQLKPHRLWAYPEQVKVFLTYTEFDLSKLSYFEGLG